MKKSVSTKLTGENIQAVMTILEGTATHMERWGAALSPDDLRRPLGDGERSLTEDLAHLINCETCTAGAIYLALLTDQPLLPKIHPERDWGKLVRHEMFEFDELLAYFQFRRRRLLRVLGALTDAQWARVVREEGKQRQESVYWLARTLALHELAHVTDLQRKLD